MNVENWLALISICLAVVGGILGYIQWLRANKIRRVEFLHSIIDKFRFNKEIANTMYELEYDEFVYSKHFHGSAGERAMDGLISYSDYICFLLDNNLLKTNELSLLEYEIERILTNKELQKYLWNIYHFSKKLHGAPIYSYLINYGIHKKFIEENIKDKNNEDFLPYKNLNF